MRGWSPIFCLFLSIFDPISADGAAGPPLYFNEKDLYRVNCWPVELRLTASAKAKAAELIKIGYEYYGIANTTVQSPPKPCLNWRTVIKERKDKNADGDVLKDEGFVERGIPSMNPAINVEYYADHTQCRWLAMHSKERIKIQFIDPSSHQTTIDDPIEDAKPASGPWCYTEGDTAEKNPTPTRCLPWCGDKYETTRKRKQVPRKAIVPSPKINHNIAFTEHLGKSFVVEAAQRAMIFVKPSMVDHNEELLATKRNVFYCCCGVVGAVILWIAVCHFLGIRVKKRRLAIVEIQRQAITAAITRRRRDSEQEHEEEDARQP